MRFFKIVFSIIVFMAVVLSVAYFALPSEKIAQKAFDQIEKATGRKIVAVGDVSIRVFPILGVSISGIEMENADWSDTPLMITAQELRVGVKAMPLLQKRIEVSQLELISPDILLEVSSKGQANWDFSADQVEVTKEGSTKTAATESEPSTTPDVLLSTIKVNNAKLRYLDHATSADYTLSEVNLSLDWPSLTSELKLVLDGKFNGQTIGATLSAGAPMALMTGDSSAIDLDLDMAGSQASFQGQVSLAPSLSGKLIVDVTSISSLAAMGGVTGLALPDFIGNSAKLSSTVQFSRNTLDLSAFSMGLSKNAISGDLAITLADVPLITGSVNLGDFDMRSGTKGRAATTGSGGASKSTGWSTDPIDASGLGAMNAKLQVKANSFKLDGLSSQAIAATVVLDAARAAITLTEVQAYEGLVTGDIVLNARKGLSTSADITARQINIRALLSEMADINKFGGSADVSLNYLGSGNSVDAIVKSLSGQGAIAFAKGHFDGVDLDKLMRSGDVGSGTTVFDDLNATFAINDGVVLNQDLQLSLPNFVTSGEGQVNLGAQSLNYLLSPKALKARDGKGLSVPVRIKGPWSGPKIIPDLEAAMEQNLAEEKAKAEAKVKAAVDAEKKKVEEKAKKKVEKVLGVELKDGEKVEDTVKKKLESEAKKGLLNLLNNK